MAHGLWILNKTPFLPLFYRLDEFSGFILVIYDLSRTWINDKQTV